MSTQHTQDDIISLQGAAVVGLDRLVTKHSEAAAAAAAQWESLAAGAASLEERQGRYEAFQVQGRERSAKKSTYRCRHLADRPNLIRGCAHFSRPSC